MARDATAWLQQVRGSAIGTRHGPVDLLARARGQGCDAVALACTEIPLLVDENDSSLPDQE